jgi:replication factor A2
VDRCRARRERSKPTVYPVPKRIDIPRQDTYVRITGQLKSFNNKRSIGAHHIRPVTDHNEVTFHLLDATAVHLFHTRGPPNNARPPQTYSSNDAMNGIVAGDGSSLAGGNMPELGHLPMLQRQIMNVVHNAPPTNEGVHIHSIAQTLHTALSEVSNAVEQLTVEGLLYTTIDDDHVHSTYSFSNLFKVRSTAVAQ